MDETILIAAANQFLGISIQKLLQVHGFQSAVAGNSTQVLHFLSEKHYQLVIFGPRFLEKLPIQLFQEILQSIPAQTQVVVLSFNDLQKELEFSPWSENAVYQQVTANPEELIQYVRDHFESPTPNQ
jgi:DNA-binding NtrC family response regulator